MSSNFDFQYLASCDGQWNGFSGIDTPPLTPLYSQQDYGYNYNDFLTQQPYFHQISTEIPHTSPLIHNYQSNTTKLQLPSVSEQQITSTPLLLPPITDISLVSKELATPTSLHPVYFHFPAVEQLTPEHSPPPPTLYRYSPDIQSSADYNYHGNNTIEYVHGESDIPKVQLPEHEAVNYTPIPHSPLLEPDVKKERRYSPYRAPNRRSSHRGGTVKSPQQNTNSTLLNNAFVTSPQQNTESSRTGRAHPPTSLLEQAAKVLSEDIPQEILKPLVRSRKKRSELTDTQRDQLELVYTVYKYLGPDVRKKVADEVGLPQKTVMYWFQNRRAREKKAGKDMKI